MTCTWPQTIADRDLLAYVDGEASPEVEEHLAACADCRERAAALGGQERRLLGVLYRVACPSPHELGEFHLQLLPGERAREIEQHVAGCQWCAREVAELRRYLADLRSDVEHGVLEEAGARVRVWIAHLAGGVAGVASPMHVAQAAMGVRGADEGPRVYEADGIQLSIDVQSDPGQPGRHALFGLLLGPEPDEFQAHVWQDGARITSVPVDDAGNFVISGLEPGSYALILEGPAVEVHVQDLVVA